VDFVLDHASCGKILLDVKDIENPPPGPGLGFFDPYRVIRTHIDAGKRKFMEQRRVPVRAGAGRTSNKRHDAR